MKFKNKLIFNKYKVKNFKQLSNLCWAFQGVNIKNNEPIFIKIEKNNLFYNFLESEAYCLINLKGFGIPKIISYGKVGIYNILIEELLGKSLYELWELRKKKEKPNIKNICMVALQILDRLEYIHSKNYIHRDIKPQNFVNGRKDPNIIYIIDFGFAHQYRSSRTGKHIKYTNRKLTIGSMNYLSINGHTGYEQSRRDDLESLGYMLILLATGKLPWLDIEKSKIKKKLKYFKIYNLKKTLSVEKLCEGLSDEFAKYINYSRKLDFEEEPKYDYLRSLFSSILEKNKEKNDLNFFWSIKKNNNKNNEEKKSESLPNIHKRKDSSKNRLFKKIKSSLEKSGNSRKEIQNNILQLDHVNNLNIKPIYQKTYYSNNEISRIDNNMQNINADETDEQIMNKNICISDNYTKNNLNYNDSGNQNNKILKNNKSTDNIKVKNIYNNEICTNLINCLHQNNKIYYINKYHSIDNVIFESKRKEANSSINNNNYKENFYICYKNQNIKKKRIGQNIVIKRNNNYRTLFEREKEKYKNILSNRNKNSINYFQNYFDTINQKENNNNSLNMKICLYKRAVNNKDMKGNIFHKKNEKPKINNNFIDNSIQRFHRNMKISVSTNNIKKDLFKRNNDIKIFQINKSKLLKSCNSNINIYSKKNTFNTFNKLAGQNSDSKIKLTENFYKSYDRDISNIIFKFPEENKIYNKYRINANLSINNINDILSTDNNSRYINSYSLNNNISFNNGKKANLTQQNENIKFMNQYQRNFREIKKNIPYGFMLKYN